VDAMAAETAALLVLRAKEDQVAQLQTALSLQEQLAKDSGKIQTAFDLQSGAVSVPMDANFINGLGFEATQVHTERTVKHPIVYSQNKRDDPKTKKAMYEAVEVSWSNKKLLSLSDGGTRRDLRRKLAGRKQQGSQTARWDHFLAGP
ncbi:hypothetical protein THAOC_22665, partial [Thalassiosira oceanica]